MPDRPPDKTETTGFSTRAIHAGQEPDPATGAVVTPIYQTSTFANEDIDKNKGYLYSRVSNPTRAALEQNLAALEGGVAGLAFASGMAAIDAVVRLLNPGDHIITQTNMYGGTIRLLKGVMQRGGIETSHVDVNDPKELERALRPSTRLLYLESPTNPLMEIIDLRAAAAWGRAHNLRVAVDNTFLTPYYQRPLELGADLVIHSTTKYLNGHSDGIGGAVVAARAEDSDQIRFLQKAAGAILGPFDSWLVLRGIKTLAVRMRQHSENALAVAHWLTGNPKVKRVYYPGLPDHPQHALARSQMSGFGGMLSFDLGSVDIARRFFKGLRLFPLAESLGGVETLVAHPATMSHAYLTPEERARMGIGDGLVRLSVGIEDVADIIADLEQSLRSI